MPPAGSHGSRQQDASERVLMWGVALLTIAAPAAIGGAHPTTQVVLSALALALLVGYVAVRGGRGLRLVPFSGVAGLALLFTLLQVLPLPAGLVGLLSPEAHSLYQDVRPHAAWMPLSVDVPATLLACARGIGCLALLLVVGGMMRARGSGTRLLTVVALSSVGLALIAALQRATGSTAIFGFYHPRSAPGFGVFGTFVDVNHAASLLALGALVAAGLASDAVGRARRFYVACAVISTAALLFTTSRGALVGFGLGAFVLTAALASRRLGIVPALAAAAVLLLVGMATTLWTSEGLRNRFVGHPDEIAHNQKTRGWVDGMHMAADYRWTGVGRGAFEAPINAYRTKDEGVRLVYPENLIVEMASEWGIAMALVLMAMVVAAVVRLAPALLRAPPRIVGAACGVFAVVMHEMFDFGLELPGVAFPAVVTLAVVVGRLSVDDRTVETRRVRWPARRTAPLLALAAVLLVCAGWATNHTLDLEFTALRATEAHASDATAVDAAIARHPADDFLELLAAEQAFHNRRPDAMHHLNRALRLHPANWQAHRMAALFLVSMNRPAQAALEYRSALQTGMSFDPAELGRVLRQNVVDAVPQTPASLVALARGLYSIRLPAEADAAARRAVELSDTPEPFLMSRVQMSIDAAIPNIAGTAARALLAEAESAEAFALAARGLARANAIAESNAAIEAGLKRHPDDGLLLFTGAEIRGGAGDLSGARAMLARLSKVPLSLGERQRAEDLLADVADRSGDAETAMVARARSRLIAKQLHDMTLSGKAN